MKSFFRTSVGKKVIVALTGMFLMLFMTVHLGLNLTLILDDTGVLYNVFAHFMITNPIIKVVEPILGLGFLLHIFFAVEAAWKNYWSRPVRYAVQNNSKSTTWVSRNILILGGLIFAFLVLHLTQFFMKMKFTGDPLYSDIEIDGQIMKNSYLLVSSVFKTSWVYCIIYSLAAIFLGLHLSHGFWSAFQTTGLSNKIWEKRLKTAGLVFATLIGVGFFIIPVYFMVFYLI